jgi:Spy/CpxP family protein refolding chaperone
VAKMVQQFRMMKIINAINLSTNQAPRFFAVLNQFEKQLRVPRQTIHNIHQQFRRMVTSGSYNARKINRMTDQMLKAQIKIKQIEYQRYLAVKKILTAEQLAKLVLALPQIERQIRRFIRRARRGGRGGAINPWGP